MALSGTRMVLLSLLVFAALAVPAAQAVESHWKKDGHRRRAAPVPALAPSSPVPAPAPSPKGDVTSPSSGTDSPAPSPAEENQNAAAAFSPSAWPALLVCAAGVATAVLF